MGLFGMSESEAISSLQELSFFAGGDLPDRHNMLKKITEIEKRIPNTKSSELEYWLAIATRNYTAWYVRGDERKSYLETVIAHFTNAYNLSKDNSTFKLPRGTYLQKTCPDKLDDHALIAMEFGKLLIDEAIIRDVQTGIAILEPIFENTADYHPEYCSYADAFFKLGDYERCAAVALDLERRAKRSTEWNEVPPAIYTLIAKAYRAQAKKHKKNKEYKLAFESLRYLVDRGLATDNDRKMYEDLLKQISGN
ncbi:hypothetical protein ES707_08477 [subsurface metagenome]